MLGPAQVDGFSVQGHRPCQQRAAPAKPSLGLDCHCLVPQLARRDIAVELFAVNGHARIGLMRGVGQIQVTRGFRGITVWPQAWGSGNIPVKLAMEVGFAITCVPSQTKDSCREHWSQRYPGALGHHRPV
jgi:hypothetical protein